MKKITQIIASSIVVASGFICGYSICSAIGQNLFGIKSRYEIEKAKSDSLYRTIQADSLLLKADSALIEDMFYNDTLNKAQ